MIVNEKLERHQKPLAKLVRWYVHEVLGVKENNPRRYDVKYLMEKAMAEKNCRPEEEEDFLAQFCEGDETKKRKARAKLCELIHKRARTLVYRDPGCCCLAS